MYCGVFTRAHRAVIASPVNNAKDVKDNEFLDEEIATNKTNFYYQAHVYQRLKSVLCERTGKVVLLKRRKWLQ